jgi:transposase InsO family protein
MPWKASTPVSERMAFVTRLLEGERMTDLCEEYGISRKTGYKFRDRFETLGPVGLYEVSRRPKSSPGSTPVEIKKLLIEARQRHPTWGPRKLVAIVARAHGGLVLPAPSTVGGILARAGLVKPRRRRGRVTRLGAVRSEAVGPNDIWCADYKGQFRLGTGRYCYPLTVTDQASRYILACEGFEAIDGGTARAVFDDRFGRYGLPMAIRTDNGAPFASTGLFGLTQLSAYWLKLGIALERIEPGKPQQNGRHERMHRTLKQETTRPAAATLLGQQERFDAWVSTFNETRPHEALGQEAPAAVYKVSPRTIVPGKPVEYPLHDEIRLVSPSGHIRLLRGRNRVTYLSPAIGGENVGIRELPDGSWLVSFASLDLGRIDPNTMTLVVGDNEATSC